MAGLDIPARRWGLHAEVTRLAWDLGRAVQEARELNLPVEPGVREAGEALARWVALLGRVIPPT
jgi:hypothetical protein